MKKIFYGILLGILALVLFVYFGGGDYLRAVGEGADEAGKIVQGYEKRLKKGIDSAKETAEDANRKVEETTERLKEIIP